MQKKRTFFLVLILSIILILDLTGCSNDTSNEEIKSKAIQELDYLDTQIVSMLNGLNNISLQNYTLTSEEVSVESPSSTQSSQGNEESGGGEQQTSSRQEQSSSEISNITTTRMESKTVLDSDSNDIDWAKIKAEIELIDETWGVILLDLTSLNVNNDDILNFSTTLNDCILSIKGEDKTSTLVNLAKLYSFIPKYESAISASNNIQIIKQTKSYVINAYSAVEQENWSSIKISINQADETFKSITNDIDYIKNNEYKVNKTYVLMKELENSLSYEDKKLFYVKYKSLMESVNTL